MTVYGFNNKDDAVELQQQARTTGGLFRTRNKPQGDYLVKAPAGGIASGATEDCTVYDAEWSSMDWTLPVTNPWTDDIAADKKMLVGPESAKGKIIPRAIDCGA